MEGLIVLSRPTAEIKAGLGLSHPIAPTTMDVCVCVWVSGYNKWGDGFKCNKEDSEK